MPGFPLQAKPIQSYLRALIRAKTPAKSQLLGLRRDQIFGVGTGSPRWHLYSSAGRTQTLLSHPGCQKQGSRDAWLWGKKKGEMSRGCLPVPAVGAGVWGPCVAL